MAKRRLGFIPVTELNVHLGMIVTRGPDWGTVHDEKGIDCDENGKIQPGVITALEGHEDKDGDFLKKGWVEVTWQSGMYSIYTIGKYEAFGDTQDEGIEFDLSVFQPKKVSHKKAKTILNTLDKWLKEDE